MLVIAKSIERSSIMSTYEVISLMIALSMLLIATLTLVVQVIVAILGNKNKK